MRYFIGLGQVSKEEYAKHLDQFGVSYEETLPPKPISPQPWPLLLIPLKSLAKEGDRGAGDIIARTVGPIGGDAFKKWYKLLFGKDCGCGNRQEALNARWPL
jgi:hypothetical protein